MPTHPLRPGRAARGSGLIEVLILAFVMAVGLASLSRLHVVVSKEAARSANRAIALSIAQAKLDDLRAAKDFDAIGNNTGGAIPLPVGSDRKVLGYTNPEFTLNWTAQALPNNTKVKRVTVTVSWQDQLENQSTSVTLTGLISDQDFTRYTKADSGPGGGGALPKARYTPSTDNRVVAISVAVGGSVKRETLTPVTTEDRAGNKQTEFIANTYNDRGELIRREEFRTVACVCRFNGNSSSDNRAYHAAYPKWDDKRGTYIDVVPEPVPNETEPAKTVGCPARRSGNSYTDACDTGPNVDQFCTICCRDHHDNGTSNRRYDPYRKEAVTGNHSHFWNNSPTTSGLYLESCRLKRVDGFWRVYQDWFMVSLANLDLADLSDATKEATYAAYVADLVSRFVDANPNATDGDPVSLPPPPTSVLKDDSSPLRLPIGNKATASARAIYVDYIDDAHLQKLRDLKAANKEYLSHLPFYELDVSQVASWNSSASDKARVGPYDGPGQTNDLVAGEIAALATHTSNVNITSTIRRSNSGLSAFQAIDIGPETDNFDNATLSASFRVCPGCSPSTGACVTPWQSVVANGGSVVAFLTSSGSTCEQETRVCTNGTLSGSYTFQQCTVVTPGQCVLPWGGTVNSGATVTGYSAPSAANCDTIKREATCNNGTLSPSLAPDYVYQSCFSTPTCTTTVTGTVSKNNDKVTISTNGGTAVNCPVDNKQVYTCPGQITPPTGNIFTITRTTQQGVATTQTLTEACGTKTVNFP